LAVVESEEGPARRDEAHSGDALAQEFDGPLTRDGAEPRRRLFHQRLSREVAEQHGPATDLETLETFRDCDTNLVRGKRVPCERRRQRRQSKEQQNSRQRDPRASGAQRRPMKEKISVRMIEIRMEVARGK